MNTNTKKYSTAGGTVPAVNSICWRNFALVLPMGVYLAVFYLVPLGGVLLHSLCNPNLTLENYTALWQHPVYIRVLLNTLEISFYATTACIILGYPVAYAMAFFGPVWRMILLVAVLLPFWISVLVRTYSWMIILGRFGVINSFLQWVGLTDAPLELMYNRVGVLIGLTYVLLPYAVLPIHSIMLGIDRDLLRGADSLGSTKWQRFYRIFFPLSFPGVAAGYLLTFIVGVGAFVTPTLMGGPKDTVIAMSIDSQLEIVNNWGFASALSIVLLITVLLLYSVWLRFMGMDALFGASDKAKPVLTARERSLPGRLVHSLFNQMSEPYERACLFFARKFDQAKDYLMKCLPDTVGCQPWSQWALSVALAVIVTFLFFPLFIILPIAFSGDHMFRFPPQSFGLDLMKSFFSSNAWIRASINSLYTALLVTILSTTLGTLAAMGLARNRLPGRKFLYGLFISPIILPAIVNAVAIYFFIAKLKLIGTIAGLTLAHTVLSSPFVIIVMTTTLQGVDTNLVYASYSLGAGRIRTFFSVTLPLIKPGLFTAAIFAFIASFDEFITALFICGARSTTLPKQMWVGIRDRMDPVVASVAALLILLIIIIMILTGIMKKRQKKLMTG